MKCGRFPAWPPRREPPALLQAATLCRARRGSRVRTWSTISWSAWAVADLHAGGVLEELADRHGVGVEDLEEALPAVGVGGDLKPPPAKAAGLYGVSTWATGVRP